MTNGLDYKLARVVKVQSIFLLGRPHLPFLTGSRVVKVQIKHIIFLLSRPHLPLLYLSLPEKFFLSNESNKIVLQW
jgi:hypothetical protein